VWGCKVISNSTEGKHQTTAGQRWTLLRPLVKMQSGAVMYVAVQPTARSSDDSIKILFGCVGFLLLVNAGSERKGTVCLGGTAARATFRRIASFLDERVPVRETSSNTEGHMRQSRHATRHSNVKIAPLRNFGNRAFSRLVEAGCSLQSNRPGRRGLGPGSGCFVVEREGDSRRGAFEGNVHSTTTIDTSERCQGGARPWNVGAVNARSQYRVGNRERNTNDTLDMGWGDRRTLCRAVSYLQSCLADREVCFRDGCLGVSSEEAPEEGLLNSPHNNIARGLQRTHEAAIEPAGVAEYLTFVVCAPLCFTIQIQAHISAHQRVTR
jgi:hypothetical protein